MKPVRSVRDYPSAEAESAERCAERCAERSAEHSTAVREIQDVPRALPRGFHAEQQIIAHGADVQSIAEVEDERKQSHGDVITFALGCSG